MTGTAPLFEQYFKEHEAVSWLSRSKYCYGNANRRSPRVVGSNETFLNGQTRCSNGSRTAAASGSSPAWILVISFSGTHGLCTTARRP